MQALLEELDLAGGEPGDDADVAIYTPPDEAPSIPGLDDEDRELVERTGVLRLFDEEPEGRERET